MSSEKNFKFIQPLLHFLFFLPHFFFFREALVENGEAHKTQNTKNANIF